MGYDQIPRIGQTHLIVARSGGGADAQTEPGHVSIYLIWDTGHKQMTDLTGAPGQPVQINIYQRLAPGAPVVGDSIYRGWDVGQGYPGHVRLRDALAEANRLQQALAGVDYGRISGTLTTTWNCSDYAEKVLRAAGLNVSAGFFVSTPLELTTGHSGFMRYLMKKRNDSSPMPRDLWYRRFGR